jgi:adenylate kinase family enzyme
MLGAERNVAFRRVAVVGAVGSGKSTLAREIARRIDAPHIELDALRYQPDWVEEADETFRRKVVEYVGTDKWVIDGNYADVQDLIWVRAQLLVWIDFRLSIVLWRLLRRTFRRLLTREEFNSNREQFWRVFGSKSILLWAIQSHGPRRRRYEELVKNERYAHLQVVRLRSPSAVSTWLAGLREPAARSKIEPQGVK